MKKRRSILCCLLCMLLSLYGTFLSYAYSVASKSDADYYMHNAQEFVPNFVPMSSDPATKSNADSSDLLKSISLPLRSSLNTVSNTVDREGIVVRVYSTDDSDDAGTVVRMGVDGSFTCTKESNINRIRIYIPKDRIPSYGTFEMSSSLRTIAGPNILSCEVEARSEATGATPVFNKFISNSDFQISLADYYLAPKVVKFENFNQIVLKVFFDTTQGSRTIDSVFAIRYTGVTEGNTQTPVEAGSDYDTGAESAQIAQNTAELVYSQNETNGLLEDIIQHISDQLAAMWDQIYNLMAVPWIQNDNQRTNNTISAIEENSENTQTTIEEQTQWHGNFIIEGLKSLFIPDNDYFESVRTDLSDWFEQHFGFLAQAIDYFISILDVFTQGEGNTVITFPGISVPNVATGETYVILKPRTVNVQTEMIRSGTFVFSDVFPNYQNPVNSDNYNLVTLIRTVNCTLLTLSLIRLFIDKLHKIEGM